MNVYCVGKTAYEAWMLKKRQYTADMAKVWDEAPLSATVNHAKYRKRASIFEPFKPLLSLPFGLPLFIN